jgi:hypothetical protein
MEAVNLNDSIKLIVLFAGVLLAGIGLIVVTEQYLGPKAVLTQEEKPPASIDVFIMDNEIWIRPLDINGESTKYPGNVQIELSRVTKADGVNFSYTHMLTNVVHISHFDLIYINNRGNASNVYAATSELNVPDEKGLYRIRAVYYPSGEDYSLSKDIIRGV